MTAETHKRDAGVKKMKENSELKERISQLEKEVARLQDLHGNYSEIGVQTMTERELGLLPVSDVTVDRLYCMLFTIVLSSSTISSYHIGWLGTTCNT